jgi:hypothetical protein
VSVKLVPEEDLRVALRPDRVDASAFEAGIRARIKAAAEAREDDRPEEESQRLRVAAAFLPWPLFTGGKLVGGGAKLSSMAFGQKLLGYAALPAISLFFLVGAAFFSAAKIRSIQTRNHPDIGDVDEMHEAVWQWWGRHKWGALAVYAAVPILTMIGSTWLLFVLLLVSFGSLLFFLSGFAKLGVGNRLIIGQLCVRGLGTLTVPIMLATWMVGGRDIHFVDQMLISAVFLGGTLLLLQFQISSMKSLGLWNLQTKPLVWLSIFHALPLIIWLTNPIWWPTTPARIKHHVESFETGRYPFIAWGDWEISASWTIEAGLDPDLSRARRLLADEISGEQNPWVLASAFRVGIVETDQIKRLAGLEKERRFLIPEQPWRQPDRLSSLDQQVWVIHALEQSGQLSPQDRDFLEQRLLATLDELADETYDVLKTALRATQLLEVIDRPIDRDQYRRRVHEWLCEFHTKKTYLFQISGGFEDYKGLPSTLCATSHAIELMKIYGIPDGLDLNWVRSYLRPHCFRGLSNNKWIAAVTLDRLNRLPGVTQPTWLEIMYYERSLIAAMVLVALCFYATLSSPMPVIDASSKHDDIGNS